MHLVGATSRFVRKPFLRQAVLNGVFSAFIALILLVTVFYALNNTLETIELTFTLTNLLILISSLVVMGVFITFVSTWIALNKYLRMKLDKLY
jgi:cell division transport system permease protein